MALWMALHGCQRRKTGTHSLQGDRLPADAGHRSVEPVVRSRIAVRIVPLLSMLAAGAYVACSSDDSATPPGDAGTGRPRDATTPDAPSEDANADAEEGGDAAPDADSDQSLPDAPPSDAPNEATPAPIVLASDVPNPSLLVTDGAYVYWTDFVVTDAGQALGRVMKVAVTGGAESTLATEPGTFPSGLAVDAVNVYWVDDHGSLFAAPLDGGAPAAGLYDAAGQNSIATDGVNVYVESNFGGGVAAVPIDGSAIVPLAAPDAGLTPAGVSIDGTNVYWPAPAGGAILAVPKAGGSTFAVVTNGDAGAGAYVSATNYQNVVSDGRSVYWNHAAGGAFFGGGVLGASLAGGRVSVVFEAGAVTPFSVATDGANVYFLLTSDSAPALVKAPVDGGPATVLAANQFAAGITGDPGPTVAVDSTSVYWLAPPQILKSPK